MLSYMFTRADFMIKNNVPRGVLGRGVESTCPISDESKIDYDERRHGTVKAEEAL